MIAGKRSSAVLIGGESEGYMSYVTRKIINSRYKADEDCEYIYIEYESPGEDFEVFGKMYEELQMKARFTNLYEGVIIADISEWAGHEADEKFDIILSFLYDHREYIKPVFKAKGDEDNIKALTEKTGEYFETEFVNTYYIDKEDFINYLRDMLGYIGLEMESDDIKKINSIAGEKIKSSKGEEILKNIIKEKRVDVNTIGNIIRGKDESKKNEYNISLIGGM